MGSRFGRYELGRILGVGGAGIVREAVLDGPAGRRRVALKIPHTPDEAALVREARITGLLRHRHLVDVYEVSDVDGTWFAAMELCEGGSLEGRGPLPPRAVVEVGLAVCSALAYGREALDLVHLDLKPANLFATADGEVKVGDLGIASANDFRGGSTRRGSPAYMAPEQLRGGAVDGRTDLYALGVTLAELATGCRPGAAETMDAWDDAGSASPSTPAVVPAWLAPAVDRCLEPEMEDRWSCAEDLAEALAGLDAPGESLAVALDLGGTGAHQARASTTFIGRASEIASLEALLEEPSVVALVGAAGVGKSRLAHELARVFGGPSFWVDVADADGADELLASVARVLEVPGTSTELVDVLGYALAAHGRALLVLDNAERLHAHGDLLRKWRAMAPTLSVLVTTRRHTELDGARLFEVSPLPDPDAMTLVAARAAERGVEVRRDAELKALVQHLGGLPLALELAAGRLGVLTVADVQARLGQGVLRSTEEGRHGTLKAAFQWTVDLLGPSARSVFEHLGVFRGGFQPQAVQAVVGLPGPACRAALDELVSLSLVRSGPRFDFLPGVADFVRSDSIAPDAADRHARWYAHLGELDILDALDRPEGVGRLELRAERQNLLHATRHAIGRGLGCALPLTRAVTLVLRTEGPMAQAVELTEALVHDLPAGASRAEACLAAGVTARYAGDVDRSGELLTTALAAFGEGEDRRRAEAIEQLGILSWRRGDLREAQTLLEEALALAVGQADRAAEVRGILGVVLHHRGELAAARIHEEACVEAFRALGNRRNEAIALGNLGTLYHAIGRLEDARACYDRAIPILRELSQLRPLAVYTSNLANLVADETPERARALFSDALELARVLGDRRSEGRTLGSASRVASDAAQARAYLERALVLARSTGDRGLECLWLSEICVQCGGPELDGWSARAEQLAMEIDSPDLRARASAARAVAFATVGDFRAARSALEQAEALGEPSDSEFTNLLDTARAHVDAGA